MATAADYVIAEVEHLVELGEIARTRCTRPAVYVDAIVPGERYEKRIEKRTVRRRA